MQDYGRTTAMCVRHIFTNAYEQCNSSRLELESEVVSVFKRSASSLEWDMKSESLGEHTLFKQSHTWGKISSYMYAWT